MAATVRRLSGIAGIVAWWSVYYASIIALMFAVIGILRPQDIDAGEGPLRAFGIGLMIGAVSGAVFALLLAAAERRKLVGELRLFRIALWGVVASATLPLVTGVDNRMVLVLCPLGAIWAALSLAIARSEGPLGRLMAEPIEAASGANA